MQSKSLFWSGSAKNSEFMDPVRTARLREANEGGSKRAFGPLVEARASRIAASSRRFAEEKDQAETEVA